MNPPRPCALRIALVSLAAFLWPMTAFAAPASVFYVAPGGTDHLSANPHAPGSLRFAALQAPAGATVVLEDGAYDGAPDGFTVAHAGVTFRAMHWHGARVENTAKANLWGPGPGAVNDTCQGIVFGPCVVPAAEGWSGGGGDGWRFLDCEFTRNDGMGFGSHGLVRHCLFTDQWMNSFDVNNGTGFTMLDTIVRRSNRANADDDSTGDKCDIAYNLTFDGLIAYDNQGCALWFDTDNRNWVVRNCTFFANHGGSNWYTFSVGAKAGTPLNSTTTAFPGYGQDGAGIAVGARVMAVSGTAANLHRQAVVTATSGYNPTLVTLSPALPAAPANGDVFVVQQGPSQGYGLMSEANPNGSFLDNLTYSNTDAGFFDADSGDGVGVARPGLTITGNQFDYDGIAFRSITGGPNNPTRKLGPAVVQHNRFRMGARTARNAFHWGGTNWLEGFPGPHFHIDFDKNTYAPDPGYTGTWADWYIWSGGPTTHYSAHSLRDLQDPATFDQDQHSVQAPVPFRGTPVAAYIWPSAKDTSWADIYHPNNVYGAAHSIHQVHDHETPYIQQAVAGKKPGQRVRLTVFGHTVFRGAGPFACEVYDYSGRWLTLTLPNAAAKKALDAAVPGYAVLAPSRLWVRLTCNPSASPYALTALYPAAPKKD